jgi:hypothetical protein
MNNRIKELAKEAFELAHEVNDIYEQEEGKELSQTEFGNVFNQKFAQLIIAECVQVAHPKLTDVGEWAAGMRLVQKRLKEHFGVKE